MTHFVMRYLAFTLLFASVLALGPWADAKGELEVYDAIDSKAAPANLDAPLPVEMPEVRTRTRKQLKSKAKSRPTNWGKFDLVPENQRDAIADRLQTVAELIREHGRAYDYRVHTQRELEAFLKRLTPSAPKRDEPNSDPLPPPPPVLMPACIGKC